MMPLLPLVLAAATANPCATLDLPSALALAARRSDEVAIRQAEVHAAEADQALARAIAILPSFTATVTAGVVPAAHARDQYSLQPADTNYTNRTILRGLGPFGRVDVQAAQPLWTWGQIDAARDAAQAGVNARNLLVKNEVSAIQMRVVQLFFAQVLARKLLAIAADVEGALAQVDKKIAESLENDEGDISTEDRYRVALFKTTLAQRKADAQKGLDLARIGLAATLGMDPQQVQFDDAALDAAGPDLPQLQALLHEAESQRPDLQALDQAIHAREAEVRAKQAAMLPALALVGTFTYSYAPNRDIILNPWVSDPFNQLSAGVALAVRQNLSFPMMKAEEEKAQAELEVLKTQRSGVVRLIDVQVEGAHAEAIAARTRFTAAQSGLSSGKAWFRSAALNFGVGVDDAKALLDAYTGYVESQVGVASAAYDLIVARAKLDQLTGKSLSKGEGKCVQP